MTYDFNLYILEFYTHYCFISFGTSNDVKKCTRAASKEYRTFGTECFKKLAFQSFLFRLAI